MDKKKVIVICVALIAIIVILAGTALALMGGGDDYMGKIDLANRYLDAGDYNNAILTYQEAISIAPAREEAYSGLYRAYISAGRRDYARTTLESGIAVSNSSLLRDLLNQHDAEETIQATQATAAPENLTQTETAVQEENKNFTHILNTSLLDFLSTADFNDYVTQYGASSPNVSSGNYSYHLSNLGATVVYHDTTTEIVINQGAGTPYAHYRPNQISLDNITVLFGGEAISFTTMKNLPGVVNATIQDKVVSFEYAGCSITITCDDNEMITAASPNTLVPAAGQGATGEHIMAVKVTDATSGAAVNGVKVEAYPGYGTYGTAIEGTTDSMGQVDLALTESGTYTVKLSKNDYITETFEVYVQSSVNKTEAAFSISPVMSQDTIRFVLTWGSSPSDLDSYLIGNAGDGTSTRVHFLNFSDIDSSGNTIAELDVDDMNGNGPETITLYDTTGSYEFAVADYNTTGTMSTSGAQVKIYVGNSLYQTVDVPAGVGDGWSVCKIVNGEITITNTPKSTSTGQF